MQHLLRYFLRGLIVFVPAAATVAIFVMVFQKVDRWMGIPFPGAGFVATLLLIVVIGALASNFVTKRLFEVLEALIQRVPLVKLVHAAIRDLTGAFVGERRSFERPVLVELVPGSGARAVGFATRDSLGALGLTDHVAVYFPQAYAVAGLVVVFPKSQVTPLDVPSAEAMAFVLSGGVSGLGAKA
jgi:uncharacterized membrane protein